MEKIPFFEQWTQRIQELLTPDFLSGVTAGLALAAVILIILSLFFLLWSRDFSIVIRKDSLTLRLSGKTIRSYIESLVDRDARLNVEKVILIGRQDSFRILLKVSMQGTGEESFPVIAEQIKLKISKGICETFGIDTLKSVDFELLSIPDSPIDIR